MNEIIDRAKAVHRDDFTQILSFYNYDLDETAKDSTQLDSLIYKATTGIVLHDLRSDWADNMYLLWGAAHYLQKQFDSAYLTFQFINYAFAPKEKDGYYQYIGSRMDGNSAVSVSTKEKNSLTKKVFTRPPSRNDAFIWQVRTFLAWGQYPEAATLIVTLRSDPVFPSRLQNDLEEVTALYYYRQHQWDSSAAHLTKALSNANSNQEKARWEFLAAQMYEMSGKNDLAENYYEKAIGHTVDPIMAVYARLYSIKVHKSDGGDYIEKNVQELEKMARHDRFREYRDVIYYMAAQMELQRNDIGRAQELLEKATKYDHGNPSQRNKAYLKLAELAFASKDYRQAYNFYDSVRVDDPELRDVDEINAKKDMLGRMAMQVEIMKRQDSLQRIAGLPEEERKQFVTKLLKDLRKQAGLKESGNEPLTSGFGPTQLDIFSMTQSSKGEWYFYNTALRAKGVQDFKARWGNRPNVDNWRRMQGVMNQKNLNRADLTNNVSTTNPSQNGAAQPQELTFENLYNNLPLTPEQLKLSNDSIQNAMFELGKILVGEVEDCDGLITIYEQLRNKFPEFDKMDEVLFHLYYCYDKNGDHAKSAQLKSELNSKYPASNLTTIVMTGKDPKAEQQTEATRTYEQIYDLFIEGKFDDAIAQKKAADSIYGENYWSPQLLYIESVYYIKQQNDSAAISELKRLASKYQGTLLAERATTMIDVLGRRKQIEEELTNLKIEEPAPEVKKQVIIIDTVATRPQVIKTDTAGVKKPVTALPGRTDSVVTKKTAKPILAFSFNAAAPHYVMIILNKVDVVFGNETKNAFARYNSEKYYNKSFELTTIPLDADNKLVLIKPFDNAQAAIDYINQAKPKAASEIVPWLKAEKYSFSIITDQNLEVLKSNPDLTAYKLFLDQNLPGKF